MEKREMRKTTIDGSGHEPGSIDDSIDERIHQELFVYVAASSANDFSILCPKEEGGGDGRDITTTGGSVLSPMRSLAGGATRLDNRRRFFGI